MMKNYLLIAVVTIISAFSVKTIANNNLAVDGTVFMPVVDPVPDQGFCNGAPVSITFSGGSVTTVYNWTNTNTAIGLGASGSGNLNFIATNPTAAPISGTITVTPVDGPMTGTPITFTIGVANEPGILSVTGDNICQAGGVANLSATANGTINWWNALTGGVLVNTGPTYNPNLNAPTTYYLDATTVAGPQSLLAMPAQSNTFPGNVRGYWFTAPTNFVITSLRVPTTASSGPQSIAVMKFNGNTPPPIFSATTNAFTIEFLTRENPVAGKIPCNIQVQAGEVIGILGSRGGINTYAPGDYATTIAGFPVQLERLGMQFPLATTNPRDIWREFGVTTSISRIEFEYSVSPNCVSTPRVPVTVAVNPAPTVTATPASQSICSGSAITTIMLSGNGTAYNWSRDNAGTVTGIPASGSGDISGSLTNTTNAPITVTFTITPLVGSCSGTPISATVVVNPIPNVVATPPSQTICSGSAITTIVLSGNVTGAAYNWTRDNTITVTGIGASGSGDISGSLTNTTNAPITVTFTITPTANNCTGTTIMATVVVNPIPNVVATPASQTICSGSAITTIVLNGNVTGAAYNWTRDNAVTVTGIPASGSGNISGSLTNTTNAPITVTFTITPTANNCTGTPIMATVVVNPIPNVVATPAAQTLCNNSTTSIGLSGNVSGTTFSWIIQSTTGSVSGQSAGSGTTIAQTLINSGTSTATVTYRITPTGPAPANCAGPTLDVTVTVSSSPAITCPSAITVNSSADGTGNCSGTANWTHPTVAAGPCGPVVLTMSIDGGTAATVTPGSAVSQAFGVGSHTVTYVVRDGKTPTPNSATCSFTVTVNDNEAPTLVCRNGVVLLAAAGNYTLVAADVFNAGLSSDNCPAALTVTNISPATVTCAQVGQTIPVTVTVRDGANNTATCTAQITIQEGTGQPSGWSSNNVGNANGNGDFKPCIANGQFTVSASGFSTSSADVLHLTSRQLCGNGEIIAHVASVSNGGWAGIMLRESLAQGSKMVALKTQSNGNIRRMVRSTTNGPVNNLNYFNPTNDWLRLVRNGSNFVGYTSPDGVNWTFAFSATVSMTGCIYAGVFAESINTNVTTTAVFNNVQVIGGTTPSLVQAPQTPEAASTFSPEVYPNPTTGEVNIDLSGYADPAGTVKVFDAYGKLVMQRQLDGFALFRMKLDGNDGIYFLSIEVEGMAPVTRRVVIAH